MSRTINIELGGNVKLCLLPIKKGEHIKVKFNAENTSNKHTKYIEVDENFWMGKYEVTQAQYKAVMGTNQILGQNANSPIVNISWDDAMLFCQKLNTMTTENRPVGYIYSLPSELLWEYACRAGKNTDFYSGNLKNNTGINDNLNRVGWYINNSKQKVHGAGLKMPNKYGLFDMHGNVWEWCLPNNKILINNDINESQRKNLYPIRGGSFLSAAIDCQSISQKIIPANTKSKDIGFRVALIPAEEY